MSTSDFKVGDIFIRKPITEDNGFAKIKLPLSGNLSSNISSQLYSIPINNSSYFPVQSSSTVNSTAAVTKTVNVSNSSIGKTSFKKRIGIVLDVNEKIKFYNEVPMKQTILKVVWLDNYQIDQENITMLDWCFSYSLIKRYEKQRRKR